MAHDKHYTTQEVFDGISDPILSDLVDLAVISPHSKIHFPKTIALGIKNHVRYKNTDVYVIGPGDDFGEIRCGHPHPLRFRQQDTNPSVIDAVVERQLGKVEWVELHATRGTMPQDIEYGSVKMEEYINEVLKTRY